MAVDPKVVGGGAVVVAIGGGSGYAISQAVSSSEENKVTLKTIKDSSATGTIAETIKNASFELLTEESDWTTLINKNSDSAKEALQNRCKGLLTESYQPNNEYQEAIKKCTKPQTLKERAEAWGLTPLKTENDAGQTTNSDDNTWSTRATDNNKNTINTNTSKTKETLIQACKEAGNKDHFDSSFNETLWENYLKECIKETTDTTPTHATALTYSYWTKKTKVKVSEKLTAAGFQTETNYTNDTTNNCTGKINWGYNINTYKEIAVLCAKNKTFKNKAVTGYGLSALEDADYQTQWNKPEVKKAMKTLDSSITSDTWDTNFKDKIKAKCDSTDQITSSVAQEQWVNYLLACTKDKTVSGGTSVTVDSIKVKDFWTGASE